MTTYETLAKDFATARNPEAGKPIANNTRIMRRGNNYAIRLHNTDVLTFEPDGSVIYDSGGWRTVTTKERMNRFGPVSVWSNRGSWRIGGEYIYADGCKVLPDGSVEGAADKSAEILERKLRKQAAKYAKQYTEALYAGEIPTPSGGDCWACCMKASDGTRPMGGPSHIIEHMKEGYFVPSLAWNALDAFGASVVMRNDVAGLQNLPGKPDDWKPWGGSVKEQIQKAIRKHCIRELGYAA